MLYSAVLVDNASHRRLSIHLIAIGGTGMAPLACLLKEAGHRVRGSDGPLYPPMSELLESAGIEPLVGFDAAHLEPPPDLVVVGNAVPRDNAEAVETERRGLPRISLPQTLYRFFLDGRRPLVVAGTHGKTTTSAIAAWVLRECGEDPGYLLGGLPLGLPSSFHRGSGDRFVVEGDEYNAAYFDRGPKFLHYHPETLLLTSVEHDHVDLYPTHGSLLDAYRQLVAELPDAGLLVAYGDDEDVRRVAEEARCRVRFYGLGSRNDVRAESVDWHSEGSRFEVVSDGARHPVRLPLAGRHNLTNALAVWTAAVADGHSAGRVAEALASFRGVRRRMELLGEAAGVAVIDDFAHHPTAVRETLRGLRQRFPARRLTALFEPRSLSAGRAHLFQAYVEAFSLADRVALAPIFHRSRLEPGDRLDLQRLAGELQRVGIEVDVAEDLETLFRAALHEAKRGDVLVTMSSGSFGGLPRRLLTGLAEREPTPAEPWAG